MIKKCFFLLLPFFHSLFSFEGSVEVDIHSTPVHVIMDTDAGIGDMIALLYLVKTPHLDLKAITTVSTGTAKKKQGAQNILSLLTLAQHPKIPVSIGARNSLSPVGEFPEEWQKAATNVMGIRLPTHSTQPVSELSPTLLIELIKGSPFKMTLLCIGPLTNIAIALQRAPEIKEKIKAIYIAAGAILSKGNIQDSDHLFSEYNIYLDAKAASLIFTAGLPITLVPIDTSKQVPLTGSFYEKLAADHRTPSSDFTYELLKAAQGDMLPLNYSGPALAAVLVTHPNLAIYREVKVKIDLEKGKNYGRVLVEKDGYPIRVVTEISASSFYSILLATLNRSPHFKLGYNNK